MREKVSAEAIERFMKALGRTGRTNVRIYFVGGVSAVLLGWRESTIDSVDSSNHLDCWNTFHVSRINSISIRRLMRNRFDAPWKSSYKIFSHKKAQASKGFC